jgi:hypothetical protein
MESGALSGASAPSPITGGRWSAERETPTLEPGDGVLTEWIGPLSIWEVMRKGQEYQPHNMYLPTSEKRPEGASVMESEFDF